MQESRISLKGINLTIGISILVDGTSNLLESLKVACAFRLVIK